MLTKHFLTRETFLRSVVMALCCNSHCRFCTGLSIFGVSTSQTNLERMDTPFTSRRASRANLHVSIPTNIVSLPSRLCKVLAKNEKGSQESWDFFLPQMNSLLSLVSNLPSKCQPFRTNLPKPIQTFVRCTTIIIISVNWTHQLYMLGA